jgi:thiol-disulfide isomerase/thioredoxin
MKLKITIVFLLLAGAFVYFGLNANYFSFGGKETAPPSNSKELSSDEILNHLYSSDLRDYEGNKVVLTSYIVGKPARLIIHLWASWCSPCVNEVPELITFSKKNPEVKFIIISLDQYTDDIAKFMKSFPEFNSERFIRIWDADNNFSKFINADRLPMSVIIKSDKPQPQIVQSVVDWKYLDLNK